MRAAVINSGNANAETGEKGFADALAIRTGGRRAGPGAGAGGRRGDRRDRRADADGAGAAGVERAAQAFGARAATPSPTRS